MTIVSVEVGNGPQFFRANDCAQAISETDFGPGAARCFRAVVVMRSSLLRRVPSLRDQSHD